MNNTFWQENGLESNMAQVKIRFKFISKLRFLGPVEAPIGVLIPLTIQPLTINYCLTRNASPLSLAA